MSTDARPERTCVGCRKRDSQANLLRMVVAGGVVLPDERHQAPGRGAHLHPVTECLDLAERRKAWPRAFKVPGPLDAHLVREYVDQHAVTKGKTSAAARPPAETTAKT
ncbi:YlxR family protein [Kribbella sp. NBC_01245]|uniref:YlxR family protein n=1 Tax=Kribbella sp. NBC_01245 TaxID=2903578 RepID=UPI002E2CEDD1|nr:YlxR family protein [Kribbella sp. NBC_01245]